MKNPQQEITIPLIDIGPAAVTGNGIDLTEAAFNALGGASRQGVIDVDFTVIGGARSVASGPAVAANRMAPVVMIGDVGDVIPIPDPDTFNRGLTPAKVETMLNTFGQPGLLSQECSEPAANLKPLMDTGNVGPFRVTGLHFAMQSLCEVFEQIRKEFPEVFTSIKTEGMLCVRGTRVDANKFSNHSWGTAIDLFFGKEVVPQGSPSCQRGLSLIAELFNRHGWYWGAGFRDRAVDSMHFELAEETIRNSSDLLRPAP